MLIFRYIDNTATLEFDEEVCIGCGRCVIVCPHRIFLLRDGRAAITDHNRCRECGACAPNCPVAAIRVTPGVGCAAYIIGTWLGRVRGKKATSGGCC